MDSGQLVEEVAAKLNDVNHVRWTKDDLIDYLNSGCLELCRVMPSANSGREVLTLASGTRQSIGPRALSLIDVVRNVPSGRAIRQVHADALDAVLPMWHGMDAQDTIKEYSWKPSDPKIFWVYPPANQSVKIECTVCKMPPIISEPTGSDPYDPFPLRDEYAEAVKSWMLYQAYMVDTGTGAVQKAQLYSSYFYKSLGIGQQGMPQGVDNGQG